LTKESEKMAEASQKRLSMIVFSGDLDKLFAAFSIAGGAAASGLEVVMFFTFWGLRALKKKKPTGRTLFGRMLGKMYGGDIERSAPSRMNFGGIGRWMFKKMMKARRIPSLFELRQTAIDLGVKFYGCQTSMSVMEIPKEALIDEVMACVGVAFFLEQAQQSEISLFI
jgi:peroxiredoxin family protein